MASEIIHLFLHLPHLPEGCIGLHNLIYEAVDSQEDIMIHDFTFDDIFLLSENVALHKLCFHKAEYGLEVLLCHKVVSGRTTVLVLQPILVPTNPTIFIFCLFLLFLRCTFLSQATPFRLSVQYSSSAY